MALWQSGSRAPRLVATIGLHGSASTWVFNVTRDLMSAALGPDRVAALYADSAAAILEAGGRPERHLLVKAHRSGGGMDALLWLTGAPVVLSLRDPRDATLSLMQRFDVPFEAAAGALAIDCAVVHRYADAGHPVLRYEHRFFDDPTCPARLASALSLNVSDEVCRAAFERYRTEAVRAFAETLQTLPPERLAVGPGTSLDRVTQIHAQHIGDGAVGKWRTLLDGPQRQAAAALFAPFLRRFDYDR